MTTNLGVAGADIPRDSFSTSILVVQILSAPAFAIC